MEDRLLGTFRQASKSASRRHITHKCIMRRALETRVFCVLGGASPARTYWGVAAVVRTAIGADARLPTRRTAEERLIVRWPGVYAALARATQRLPPQSRIRRSLLRRNALSGWGAWVRGDLDVCLVRFSPNWHYEPPREWLIPGLPTVYRGHDGLRQWFTDLR